MSSPSSAFLPMDAIPAAAPSERVHPQAKPARSTLLRRFVLFILSSLALFGGLPLWLEVIATTVPGADGSDWGVYRLVVVGGVVAAVGLGVYVAATWVQLVKQLARTDWVD